MIYYPLLTSSLASAPSTPDAAVTKVTSVTSIAKTHGHLFLLLFLHLSAVTAVSFWKCYVLTVMVALPPSCLVAPVHLGPHPLPDLMLHDFKENISDSSSFFSLVNPSTPMTFFTWLRILQI